MTFNRKFVMRFICCFIILSIGVLATACGGEPEEMSPGEPTEELSAILSDPPSVNPFDHHLDSAPDDGCERIRIHSVGPLRKVFNDSNHVQLVAAQQLGFPPIQSGEDIMRLRRPVVRVDSCEEYYLEELTHSFPYLVPEAAQFLKEIGRAFNDSLQARGGGAYRLKVTSVLRTPATVKKLRRVNRNATEESTHSYGTTFDISYSKFICDDASAPHRSFEDLKNLLAEILYKFREEGRCYVKFEYRQSCFHITTRPTSK